MSDLVGNSEDRFSYNEAHFISGAELKRLPVVFAGKTPLELFNVISEAVSGLIIRLFARKPPRHSAYLLASSGKVHTMPQR